MLRLKVKQKVSLKVLTNNQESINIYQCYMQRVYNQSRTSMIKELVVKQVNTFVLSKLMRQKREHYMVHTAYIYSVA
jgi:hypothetical protein